MTGVQTCALPISYDLSLGTNGLPRAELFVADKLHFNAAGYKLLAQRVRPFLPK